MREQELELPLEKNIKIYIFSLIIVEKIFKNF